MPAPRIGNPDRRAELNSDFPQNEVLGHINADDPTIDPKPKGVTTTWTNSEGQTVTLTEPPPPWEVDDGSGYSPSDARKFVEVPPNWRLRWINPRLLDSEGWRDWQALQASDARIKVKVFTMVTPEGHIRRGGPGGDILCWTWQGWYESKIREHIRVTNRQTQDAVDKQENLRDEFKRGTYGPNIRLEDAKHPTHTQVDGRTIRD